MGKDGGPMTAKAIAKKIKAKGLGRLRWYCQMCEKQCRDENGFQNHLSSESHKRLLAIFAESPNEFVSGFSEKFKRDFLKVLKQRWGTSFVLCNTAYQEYISDRHHLHMNATRWTTLSGFVQELGRTAQCVVELRDTGYWIKLIDREAAARAEIARADDRRRADELHRAESRLQTQMKIASTTIVDVTESDNENDGTTKVTTFEQPVKLQLRQVQRTRKDNSSNSSNVFSNPANDENDDDALNETVKKREKKRKSRWEQGLKKKSTLDEIVATGESKSTFKHVSPPRNTSKSNQTESLIEDAVTKNEMEEDVGWVLKGIEVCVNNKELANGEYYGKKGQVVDVIDEFGAKLRLLERDVMLQLDQDDLETVVPGSNASVVLLKGKYRGRRAIVQKWNEKESLAILKLEGSGEMLRCKYAYFTKVAVS